MAVGLVAMVLGLNNTPSQATAISELKLNAGDTGTVYYDTNNVYTMVGTRNGAAWSDQTAPMAISPDKGGNDELVFCVEPGVPFLASNNPGYQSVGANDIPHDVQVASIIWNQDFGLGGYSEDNRVVTQAVIWELLPYGIKVNDIPRIPNFAALKAKLYEQIANYKKLPEFNKQTIELTYGQSKVLNSSVDLRTFETQVSNSAKVTWDIAADGKSVTVKPTSATTQSGTIAYKRSWSEGTPLAFEKQGSQRVYVPSVKDPANFVVNFDIKTVGDVKIQKVDKEDGKPVAGVKFKVEFSGEGAPAAREVTTGADGTATIKDVLQGVKVKATEIDTPNPYVLGSAVGDSDVVQGTVKAGETITLTQRNMVAKGQIIVEKSGLESKQAMWNELYTLSGNVFEIRKDSKTGSVVSTITTNADGYAETQKNLPLGTYWVVEKQASNGFANTFEAQEVKITYEDKTVAVVIKGTKGTNQEVVGSTLLTKEDAETGKETQGAATFDGATYGLFHKDGTPVKWSDNFKPTPSKGKALKGDEVKFELSDKEQQAKVDHLALGEYYWQELVAPEGYQIDNTKHNFSVTYKDQDTKVIETKTTSKEKVIKFNLDGFKYVDSKGGETKSGYNGIEFALTPVEPTKGEERKVTTKTDAFGYDGYWAFNNVPYGNYTMSEVKAPSGYKKIKDLHIKSSFDAEKREYTFTITEDGQDEAIKTLTVPEKDINTGSNVISLSKLFLTNKVKPAPTIRTKATVDGEKTFYPGKETPMHDKVTITGTEKDLEYTNKIKLWRVQDEDYENAKVVWEGEKDFVAEGDNEEQVIETMVDTSKDNAGTSYVFTEELFLKDGPKVAEHEDLTDKEQTVKPKLPQIRTLATVDGEKTFFPSKETPMHDKVTITDVKKGETYTNKIKLWRLVNDDIDSAQVVWEGEEDFVAEAENTQQVIDQMIDTSNDDASVSYVFTEELYVKDSEEPIAEHNDLTEKTQTIRPIMPGTPTIETLFVTKDGDKTFDPTKDNELVDKVTATVPKEDIGKTFYYITQFHKVDKDGKTSVVGEDKSERKADKEEFTFDAIFNYKANTLKDGEKLVATHIAYKDKDHKEEYAKHYDLSNEKQTLTAKAPETQKATLPATSGTSGGYSSLAQTSGGLGIAKVVAGLVAVIAIALGSAYFYNKNKKEQTEQ